MSQTSIVHAANVARNILGCAFSNELPRSVSLYTPMSRERIEFYMASARGVCEWAQSWGTKVTIRRTDTDIRVETKWFRAADAMSVVAVMVVQLHTPEAKVLLGALGHPETRQAELHPGRLLTALSGVES